MEGYADEHLKIDRTRPWTLDLEPWTSIVRTALVLDPIFENHKTAPGHPESPTRTQRLIEAFGKPEISSRTLRIESRAATLEELDRAHHPDYIRETLAAIRAGADSLAGGDVSVSIESGEIAKRAAGGVLEAVDAVFAGRVSNAFCAVRPPGHHATEDRAMGFCVFNNIAIAARHAQFVHGAKRIAIVDWDVHHGNGTQDIFYEDGSVLFCSTHQSPWYPGTGAVSETGAGTGEGLTINRPFPAGAGRSEIVGAFRDDFLPAIERFHPDLLLVSAGFDSRRGDPLGLFRLDDADFADLTTLLVDAAHRLCGGRLISVLEGGYNIDGLVSAASAHVNALLGASPS
jgi:acetoin utilization deacetylase AcuC-like enzyme